MKAGHAADELLHLGRARSTASRSTPRTWSRPSTRRSSPRPGITTMPTTMDQYTADLKQIKAKGVVQNPLNIPFAAAEGLSTYWYQTTAAFGGTMLDGKGQPAVHVARPPPATRRRSGWSNALKDGLVPAGQHQRHRLAGHAEPDGEGRSTASTFSDYSGNVGSLYDVPASSSVVPTVQYIPTPGVNGAGPEPRQPRRHRHPQAGEVPCGRREVHPVDHVDAEPGGVRRRRAGPSKVMPNYPTPSRLSAMQALTTSGHLAQGARAHDAARAPPPGRCSPPVRRPGTRSSPGRSTPTCMPRPSDRSGRCGDRRRSRRPRTHWQSGIVTRAPSRRGAPGRARCDEHRARAPRPGRARAQRRSSRGDRGRSPPGGRRRSTCCPYALVAPLARVHRRARAGAGGHHAGRESFFKVQPLNPPDRFDGLGNFVRLFSDDTHRLEHGQHRASTWSSASCCRPCSAS